MVPIVNGTGSPRKLSGQEREQKEKTRVFSFLVLYILFILFLVLKPDKSELVEENGLNTNFVTLF